MCDIDSGIHHMIIFTRPSPCVIRTASGDSCGGGLGTRLMFSIVQPYHEGELKTVLSYSAIMCIPGLIHTLSHSSTNNTVHR